MIQNRSATGTQRRALADLYPDLYARLQNLDVATLPVHVANVIASCVPIMRATLSMGGNVDATVAELEKLIAPYVVQVQA